MPIFIEDLNASTGLEAAKDLFRSYAAWLENTHGIDPDTHGIESEIRNFPSPYCPPDGALFGARTEKREYVGCIALRRFDAASCEVKRLFVRPEMRGSQIGRQLVEALMKRAKALGYRKAILDVGDYQAPARALYAKCGFREVPPGEYISYPGVVFMARDI
jgi:GNAT superfamily N-acetyltransferase